MNDEATQTISNIAEILDDEGIAYDEIKVIEDPTTGRYAVHIHLVKGDDNENGS